MSWKKRNYSGYSTKKFVAESLYEELAPILNDNDNILIPRAENARDYLVDKLKAICEVTEVHIYRTVIDEDKKVRY